MKLLTVLGVWVANVILAFLLIGSMKGPPEVADSFRPEMYDDLNGKVIAAPIVGKPGEVAGWLFDPGASPGGWRVAQIDSRREDDFHYTAYAHVQVKNAKLDHFEGIVEVQYVKIADKFYPTAILSVTAAITPAPEAKDKKVEPVPAEMKNQPDKGFHLPKK
jgi:hypothetical protein